MSAVDFNQQIDVSAEEKTPMSQRIDELSNEPNVREM